MNDNEIVERFFERDESALTAVYQKYGGYCAAIARNILSSEQDVEECVNEALLRLWESIPPNRPEYIPAFAGRITRNIALDMLKISTAQKRGGGEIDLLLEEADALIPSDISVESIAEQREVISVINEFLGTLPRKKRKVFVMRFWHCQSVSEIARCVGMTEANVYNVLKRERKKLMDYLRKRGF